MSEVLFEYSEISSAVKYLGKANDELDDYSTVITNKVLSALSSISGSDDCGYISAAYSAASEKKSKLWEKKNEFSTLSLGLSNLKDTAKEYDETVKDKINDIAETYIPSFWEKPVRAAGDFLYNIFCVEIGGFISDTFGADGFVEWMRKAQVKVGNIKAKVKNYFKHGAGQYLLNIADAAGDVLKAVARAGTAIATIGTLAIAAPGLMPLVILGLAAGSIYVTKEIADMVLVYKHNEKAFLLHRKGDRALAHYYGGTEDIVGWAHRTDLGGKTANTIGETLIEGADKLGVLAETVTDILFVAGSAGVALTAVYGMDGKTIVDRDFSPANMQRNFQRWCGEQMLDFGYKPSPDGTELVDLSFGEKIHNFFKLRNPAKPFVKIFGNEEEDPGKILTSVLKVTGIISDYAVGETTAEYVYDKIITGEGFEDKFGEVYDLFGYTKGGDLIDSTLGEGKKVLDKLAKATDYSESFPKDPYSASELNDKLGKIRSEGIRRHSAPAAPGSGSHAITMPSGSSSHAITMPPGGIPNPPRFDWGDLHTPNVFNGGFHKSPAELIAQALRGTAILNGVLIGPLIV